jgi:protein-S-isoprenylcysteine O-methyltransferase Ste14
LPAARGAPSLKCVTVPRPHPALAVLGALAVLALDAALLALGFGDASMLVRDPRALVLLVVWGATGVALALLRPARGQDARSVRPDPLVMLALFVLPLAAAPLGAFGARRVLYVPPYANTISWCGVALAAAGLALRVSAMARLGRRFAPVVALQREHALETGGPYAFVRHPGYLGALMACLGGSVAFGSLFALPVPALMLVAQLARVHREEALLAGSFGAEWAAYAGRTGALLPRLFGGRRPPRGA